MVFESEHLPQLETTQVDKGDRRELRSSRSSILYHSDKAFDVEPIERADVENEFFHVGAKQQIGRVFFGVQCENERNDVAIGQDEGLKVVCEGKRLENRAVSAIVWCRMLVF